MSLNVLVGTLYGPSLWFDCATLNWISAILSLVIWLNPVLFILPFTVSPTWNDPEVIVISSNLGTQNLVTFCPSMNPYNWVKGLTFLAVNSIFLDLIYGTRSLLTTLSPTEVSSNVSCTIVLSPDLCWWSVLVVCLNTSWVVVVDVSVIHWAGLLSGSPLIQPPWPQVLELLVVVCAPSNSTAEVPVHVVSHAFQITGPIPVWGSIPSFLDKLSIVAA